MKKSVGKGSYGTVYKVTIPEKAITFAIKKIKITSLDEGIPCTAIREISILKTLDHPNILTCYGINMSEKYINIYLEYCETDLHKYIKQNLGNITFKTVISFTRQLLNGLNYLHSNELLHRDIKPHNILIHDGCIKIADYGLCRINNIPLNEKCKNVVTRWYKPPEILMGKSEYDFKVDIWSAGCVVAELISGKPLFPHDNTQAHLEDINTTFSNGGSEFKRKIGFIDNSFFDLLLKMLEINPSKRITADEALKHRALA